MSPSSILYSLFRCALNDVVAFVSRLIALRSLEGHRQHPDGFRWLASTTFVRSEQGAAKENDGEREVDDQPGDVDERRDERRR